MYRLRGAGFEWEARYEDNRRVSRLCPRGNHSTHMKFAALIAINILLWQFIEIPINLEVVRGHAQFADL